MPESHIFAESVAVAEICGDCQDLAPRVWLRGAERKAGSHRYEAKPLEGFPPCTTPIRQSP